MKERTRKIAAAFLLILFAAFVGGNTLCVHTHIGPAGAVTHSHPYLPSSSHTHSVAQFETLALLNATTFDPADTPLPAPAPRLLVSEIAAPAAIGRAALPAAVLPARRGPPALA